MDESKKEHKKIRLTHSEDYYIRTLLTETKIEEIMGESVISIKVDAHFSEVAELMRVHHIRHLPVVDEGDKLVGLMTQRGLYKIQSPRKNMDGSWYYDPATLDNIILRHVMIKEPFTLHPENTIADAIHIMVNQKFGCIPVVDENNVLCGIVTKHDVLKIAAEILKS